MGKHSSCAAMTKPAERANDSTEAPAPVLRVRRRAHHRAESADMSLRSTPGGGARVVRPALLSPASCPPTVGLTQATPLMSAMVGKAGDGFREFDTQVMAVPYAMLSDRRSSHPNNVSVRSPNSRLRQILPQCKCASIWPVDNF